MRKPQEGATFNNLDKVVQIHYQTGRVPVVIVDNLAECQGVCVATNAWDCYWSHVQEGMWQGTQGCFDCLCFRSFACRVLCSDEDPTDYLDDWWNQGELPYTTASEWVAGKMWKFDLIDLDGETHILAVYDGDRKVDLSETWDLTLKFERPEADGWLACCKAAWKCLHEAGVIW